MKKLILFIFLTGFYKSIYTYADEKNIVLFPSKYVTPSIYNDICMSKNYICFPYAIEFFNFDNNNELHSLLNKLEITYQAQHISENQIHLFLKNYFLTYNDFLFLSEFIENKKFIHSFDKMNLIKNIYSQLSNENYIVLNSDQKSHSEFYFLFGQKIKVTPKSTLLLKQISNFLKISYFNETQFKNDINQENSEYYVEGNCENPQYNNLFDSFKNKNDLRIPFYSQGCSFQERMDWGSDLIAGHFKQNKNNYLWAIGLFASYLFFKEHDLHIEY